MTKGKSEEVSNPKVNVKVSVDDGEEFVPKSYIMIFVDKVAQEKDETVVYMVKTCELPGAVSIQEIGTYIGSLNDISSDLSSELVTRLAFCEDEIRKMKENDMENKNAS